PRLARIGYSECRNLKLLSMSLIVAEFWSAEDIETNQEKKDYEKEKGIFYESYAPCLLPILKCKIF
ncbi:MAG: hypothetical protein Q8O06_06565, partial [Acetobacterium sp.]|nr:hypothetical protein [Acetobacterium sp.]